MEIKVMSHFNAGIEEWINPRGMEPIEVNLTDITYFENKRNIRTIGIYKKGLFRLTEKSYQAVKKELTKAGLMWRFNYTKASM